MMPTASGSSQVEHHPEESLLAVSPQPGVRDKHVVQLNSNRIE